MATPLSERASSALNSNATSTLNSNTAPLVNDDDLPLQVIAYTDSAFTNAHDLVSREPVHDGRGTFTHLGVRMEGLESGRHLNFKAKSESSKTGNDAPSSSPSTTTFHRDHSIVNEVRLRITTSRHVTGQQEQQQQQHSGMGRARVRRLVFDTRFYTRNQTKFIYDVVAIDEDRDEDVARGGSASNDSVVGAGTSLLAGKPLRLAGDSIFELDLTPRFPNGVPCTTLLLRTSEGGLTRFKACGEMMAFEKRGSLRNVTEGGRVFGASDASYGDPTLALRGQRTGHVMAGWESCRHSSRHRLGVALAQPVAGVDRVEVDTYLHCLNPFRYMCVLAACAKNGMGDAELIAALPPWTVTIGTHTEQVSDESLNAYIEAHDNLHTPVHYTLQEPALTSPWRVLVPMKALQRDTLHVWEKRKGEVVVPPAVTAVGDLITHLMFVGVPDGGVHRVGVYTEEH